MDGLDLSIIWGMGFHFAPERSYFLCIENQYKIKLLSAYEILLKTWKPGLETCLTLNYELN